MKRDIIIGDVHGCFEELQQLLAELDVKPEDRLISAGDMVDRGPDSVRVWEFFRDRPNSVVVMGNHERKHVRGVLSYSQEIVKLQFGDRYQAFRTWASKLPYFFETPEAIIVHGGFDPNVPLEEQREDVLSGTTSGGKHLARKLDDRDWAALYQGDKPIVFGHRIVGDEPAQWNDRVFGIDTGACHGGYLCALTTPGFTTHRVKARADHWRVQRKRWEVPVLESKPWASYRFSKLEREIKDLERRRSPDAVRFARHLRAWVQRGNAVLPTLVERIEDTARALQSKHDGKALKRAIASEPSSGLLFSAIAGSLDLASVKTQLGSMGKLETTAQAFGLDVPVSHMDMGTLDKTS